MIKLKTLVLGMIAVVAVVGVGFGDRAQAAGTKSNDLGDLFILSGLFSNGNDSSGVLNPTNNAVDLGNLFILDQLFGGDSNGRLFGGTKTSRNGRSSLGDLIILNQLFNNTRLLGDGAGTANGGTGTTEGAGQTGAANLGRLFVLDKLFVDGQTGIFSNRGTTAAASRPRTNGNGTKKPTVINAPSSTINAPNSNIRTGTTTP